MPAGEETEVMEIQNSERFAFGAKRGHYQPNQLFKYLQRESQPPSPQGSNLTVPLPPPSGQPPCMRGCAEDPGTTSRPRLSAGRTPRGSEGVRAGHRNCRAPRFCGDSLRTGCRRTGGLLSQSWTHPQQFANGACWSHLTDREPRPSNAESRLEPWSW